MTVAALAFSQDGRYGRARDLVSRVQKNLRHAERFTPPNEKEKDLQELRDLRRARGESY
jgi:hypothetical protein